MLTGDAVAHIERRHGVFGAADNSMSDPNDLARIGFVVEHFESAVLSEDKSWQYRNSDNTPADKFFLKKRINGYYFVSEAAPNSKGKKIYIISAYILR